MTASRSGTGPIGVTGPAVAQGGTAGHLPVGHALREFQIERVLGEGGFSVVYLATDTRLERQVAIKEYMPTALATRNLDLSVQVRSSMQHRDAFEAGLRSFINEAKLLAKFEHRALVKVHQFWQDMGTAYMVMPYYAGPTLKSWIRGRRGPVDATWLEQFVRLLMDALETLHRENCLHRDVAPDNILLLDERSPLLLDFGAARRVIGDMSQALTVILKPGFAPIEQYAESNAMRQGPWTDVYALCAVAHFMITGRTPTPSVTRVLADDLVPLSTLAAGRFTPAFLAALDAGLTVRPQQRPQSIGALRQLMNGAAPEDSTLTAPPGSGMLAMEVPTTMGPPTTTLRPLTPTLSPGPPAEDDEERTRIVTTRDFPQRTSPATISRPAQPPVAPAAAQAQTSLQAGSSSTLDEPSSSPPAESSFGTRVPSRTMRELAQASTTVSSHGDDKTPLLPFVIGAIAIAVVIGTAWALIDWMDGDFERVRRVKPATANPAPPTAIARAPVPAPAAATAPSPAPVRSNVPGQSASRPPAASPEPPSSPSPAPSASPAQSASPDPPASPVQGVRSTPSASSVQSASTAQSHSPAAAGSSAAPAAPAAATSPAAEAAPAAATAHLTTTSPGVQDAPASGTGDAKQGLAPAAAAPAPSSAAATDAAESGSAQPSAAAPVQPAPASSPSTAGKAGKKGDGTASRNAAQAKSAATVKSASGAPKASPTTSTQARPDGAAKGGAPQSTPASSESARARPATTPPSSPTPAYEPLVAPPVAPPISVPQVTTVDASAPPPVAAVEPPRTSAPAPSKPAAAASTAPLRALSKPDPTFPREALRADVAKGTVRARLFVAADGTVSKVDILSAYPARVFDREVRETALRWRFDPPGQGRQTEVEFVFDRFKGH